MVDHCFRAIFVSKKFLRSRATSHVVDAKKACCVSTQYPCSSDGRIDFGTFLELMYQHSQVEKCQQDILAAFKAHDKSGNGKVPASELVHILSNFGEKLSRAEGETDPLDSFVHSENPV